MQVYIYTHNYTCNLHTLRFYKVAYTHACTCMQFHKSRYVEKVKKCLSEFEQQYAPIVTEAEDRVREVNCRLCLYNYSDLIIIPCSGVRNFSDVIIS